MAAEGPYITAVIGNMPEAKVNLAAFGVAFSFALLIESPIMMILTASTRLSRDLLSYQRLHRFTVWLNIAITLAMLLILAPGIYPWISQSVMGLSDEVSRLARTTAFCMLPWPAAIGMRRLYQGALIAHGKTKWVAVGTVVRLLSAVILAGIFYWQDLLPGALTGAVALAFASLAEAVMAYFLARPIIRRLPQGSQASTPVFTYREISQFYFPLALTALVVLSAQPIVTLFVGHGERPLDSLAVLPVLNALIFIFRAANLSYQEVIIAILNLNAKNIRPLRQFAIWMGAMSTLAFLLFAFTPAASFWFSEVSGLNPELTEFALFPLRISVFMPILILWVVWRRSLFIFYGNTGPVTIGGALEVSTIALTMAILVHVFRIDGATSAAFSFLAGRFASAVYLLRPIQHQGRSIQAST